MIKIDLAKLNIKSRVNLAYACISFVLGICFILAEFFGFGVLGIIIGALIVVMGTIQVVQVIKDKRDVPQDDSVIGVTLILVGLITMMPGVNDLIFALMPFMISFFGGGILIDTAFRAIFKKKRFKKGASVFLKIPIALILIALGIIFFVNLELSIHVTLVTGTTFVGFSTYCAYRILSAEPEIEPEKIPDYE
jgi:uncharacterized membrane protein HdeD (DUF308 family)